MGNLLADCQRCSVSQCELCTDALHQRQDAQGGASGRAAGGHPNEANGPGGPAGRGSHEYQPNNMSEADMIHQALRMSRLEAERARRGGAPAGGAQDPDPMGTDGQGPLLGDEDPHLMAALAASYANGSTRAGAPSEEELLAQAVRKSTQEEESRERQRLREEQEEEYEESLRIDREREAERALRMKEEEEAQRCEAEKEEARRCEEAKKLAEEQEAENARKARVAELVEEAQGLLEPEPPEGSPDRVVVLVRTPDGRRLKRAFRMGDRLSQVYHYANAEGGEGLVDQEYRLVSSMPRQVYEDREATLEACGLKGQSALLVEVIDD